MARRTGLDDLNEFPYLASTSKLTIDQMRRVEEALHCQISYVGEVEGQKRYDYFVEPAPGKLTDEQQRVLNDAGLVPVLALARHAVQNAQTPPSCTRQFEPNAGSVEDGEIEHES